MGSEDYSKRKARLSELPKGVAAIALAMYSDGEDSPTVESLLCRHNRTSCEQNDGRFMGRIALPTKMDSLDFTLFFPGSGCGMIIKDQIVAFTELGMRSFVGCPVTEVSGLPVLHGAVALVLWKTDKDKKPESELRDQNWVDQFIVINALQTAFAGSHC